MADDLVVSAPKEQRAAELVAFLTDPSVAAVVPPWGGETAIDLLDQIDWDALAAAEPTWLVGWSDMTTVMLPLTLRTGWATLHGWNLADTAVRRTRRAAALARPRRRDGRGHPDQPRPDARRLGRLRPAPRRPEDDARQAHPLVRAGRWRRRRSPGGSSAAAWRWSPRSPARRTATSRPSGASTPTRAWCVYLEVCEHGAYDVARCPARAAARRLVRPCERRADRSHLGRRTRTR